MPARRFPPPWTVEDIGAAFVITDDSGQKLAYIYFEDDPGRRSAGKLLSKDEARKVAVNIAKLPDLLVALPSRGTSYPPWSGHYPAVPVLSRQGPAVRARLAAQLTFGSTALNYRVASVAIRAIAIRRRNEGANVMTANVTVTERAARRIGEILRQEPAGTMLRVSVEGGGCSGFQYKFDTEREGVDDDVVIDQSGAIVLIDPVSLNYMAGSQIDYVDDLIGSSFKINNPKATASCGCGTSFAL